MPKPFNCNLLIAMYNTLMAFNEAYYLTLLSYSPAFEMCKSYCLNETPKLDTIDIIDPNEIHIKIKLGYSELNQL